MPRLRQRNSQNYTSSPPIHAEFESIIRYINAAELGNKTIAELLRTIFSDEGDFEGPIEFRFDAATGIEYRIGKFANDSDGWELVAPTEEIRGPSGQNVGAIEGAIFYNRTDITASGGETSLTYALGAAGQGILLFKNGLLQPESEYTLDQANNQVDLTTPAQASDVYTIYTVRTSQVTNFRRFDISASAGQAVFGFAHDDDEEFLVYLNGLLLREGGDADFVSNASNDTITLMSPATLGDILSIIVVDNAALSDVVGLMLENEYTDAGGKIPWTKLSVQDGDIPQAKVSGLVSALTNGAKVVVAASEPSTPDTRTLWIDTSTSPNRLKFYDGSEWLNASPESTLPSFKLADAGKFIRVAPTGAALEYSAVDFSNVVLKTEKGVAGGVATLDQGARLPVSQLPDGVVTGSLYRLISGSVANSTQTVQRIFRQKIRIVGVSLLTGAGSCDVTLNIDGTNVGSTYSAGVAPSDNVLGTAIEVNALSSSKKISVVITNAASCQNLEVTIAYVVLN